MKNEDFDIEFEDYDVIDSSYDTFYIKKKQEKWFIILGIVAFILVCIIGFVLGTNF